MNRDIRKRIPEHPDLSFPVIPAMRGAMSVPSSIRQILPVFPHLAQEDPDTDASSRRIAVGKSRHVGENVGLNVTVRSNSVSPL